MAGKLQVLASLFLVVAFCTCSKAQTATTDYTEDYPTTPPTPDPLIHNLQFSLPIVIVFVLLCVMAVIVVIVLRKARYGQFCCLKPKMSYRYSDDRDEEEGGAGGQEAQKPPVYEVEPTIPPPDYQDALHDAPVKQEAMAMEEIPLDEQETEDDQAPLNP